MRKKIILIAVVAFVSLGLLGASKIVQDKYLSNKSVTAEQKVSGQTSQEANAKANDKLDVKPTIVEAPVVAKVQDKSVAAAKPSTANKTEEAITQTKPKSTENVVVPKESPKDQGAKITEAKKQANLVIKDYISGKTIFSINVNTDNKSVGEITLSELGNRGINYSASGRGETVYFTMINNLKARAAGPLSGWCYYVNGSKPGVSCGAYKLKPGDVVEWKYLEDAINN